MQMIDTALQQLDRPLKQEAPPGEDGASVEPSGAMRFAY